MNQFFVYLIQSQNRLVILRYKMNNSDYVFLIDTKGEDREKQEYFCKMFCIGYILGSENGKPPINDFNEFF